MNQGAPFGSSRHGKRLTRAIVALWFVFLGVGFYWAYDGSQDRSGPVYVISEYLSADGDPYRMVTPWTEPTDVKTGGKVDDCEKWIVDFQEAAREFPEKAVFQKDAPKDWTHVRTYCSWEKLAPIVPVTKVKGPS